MNASLANAQSATETHLHPAPRKILVTSALPYANGPIHLGHLVEYIQTDIWARFQKSRGHECYYVCADDAHGTPIMLRAQAEGIAPEALIGRVHQEHETDFAGFHIGFDQYHSTNSKENQTFANYIYQQLQAKGHISRRVIEQYYDPQQSMFLPDRFIKGTCPKCGADDQYGDNCEACGATYSPEELKHPVSVISGATPIKKQTEHLFFELAHFEAMLQAWTHHDHLQSQIANKLNEWFEAGLRAWDISRDAPYFGFEIPGETDKYFYVWLDAPVGYMASFKALCDRKGLDFDQYWGQDAQTELYHFIGKDIIYFHGLFWPAMLEGAGFRTPNAIFSHGFLTINGQKMSKSRGTFIMAKTYLDHLNPEYLRYYFAAKLTGRIDDIDLNLEDFSQRVNSDLVGKVINIASRCAGFVVKKFDKTLNQAWSSQAQALYDHFIDQSDAIATRYEKRDYAQAMREIMHLADQANEYIDQMAPWVLAKETGKEALLHESVSLGINLFRVLMTYLAPVLPETARKASEFLQVEDLTWDRIQTPLLGHAIKKFKPLMTRIDPQQLEQMLAASQKDAAAQKAMQTQNAPLTSDANMPQTEPLADEIQFDDFAKLDLRVVKIAKAEPVPKADKLLKLTLDLGDQQKQVFAGIKTAYQPDALEGKLTVMVANLKPRKMRFGVSEGMVLAAGPGGEDLFLLEPDSGATPGMRIK